MAEKHLKPDYINPDLFYNRAMVNLYLEQHYDAYKDLLTADSIDRGLKAGGLAESLASSCLLNIKLLKNNCNLKPKRLTQMLSSIPCSLKEGIGYKLVSIGDMPSGGKVIVSAKVLQMANKIVDIPVSLICCDHQGVFFLLSVYNLGKEFVECLKLGASNVVLLEASVTRKGFVSNGVDQEYLHVCVSNLSKVILDGRYCSSFASDTQLSSTFFN